MTTKNELESAADLALRMASVDGDDDRPPTDRAHFAAQAVLWAVTQRRGVGAAGAAVLGELTPEQRRDIVDVVALIIRKVATLETREE